MASFVESVKNISQDSYPFFKITVLAFIVFFVWQVNLSKAMVFPMDAIVNIVAIFYLFGYFFESVNNTLNEKNIIMPGFVNPFKTVFFGCLAALAVLPSAAVIAFVMGYLQSVLTFGDVFNFIIMTIAFFLLFTFAALQLLLFAKSLNFFKAYNFVLIFKIAGDFIAYSGLLALFVLIFATVVICPIAAGVYNMFGIGLIFNYFVIYAAIFLILMCLQYYTQLYSEFIDLTGLN